MYLSQALSGAMQAGFAAEAVTMRSAEHRERLLALRPKAHDDGERRRPSSSEFRAAVRDVVPDARPAGLAQAQTGVSDEEFVALPAGVVRTSCAQAGLRRAALAGASGAAGCPPPSRSCSTRSSPPTTRRGWCWRSSRSTTRRPRCSRPAPSEQRRRHLPAILDGEIWVQGFSEPEAGSDLASLQDHAPARRATRYIVNGQKLWASGALHADWCLLLARTDPAAPKRRGISYFLLDMRSPGIDVRPIRQATGESHFCEIFLNDVVIPAGQLVGPENAGWRVAQETLGAERGHDHARAGRAARQRRLPLAGRGLLAARRRRRRPIDDSLVQDRLAAFETEITGLRALCRGLVERHEAGTAGPADASIVKLYYSELLQRMTDFGAEVAGLAGAHRAAEAGLERLGVRRLGARLHRLVGVDDPRRDQRDPAHDHRRARARPAAGAGGDADDRATSPRSATSSGRSRATCSASARTGRDGRLAAAGRVRLARARGARARSTARRHVRRGRRDPRGAGTGRGVQPLPRARSCSASGTLNLLERRPRTGTGCSAAVATGDQSGRRRRWPTATTATSRWPRRRSGSSGPAAGCGCTAGPPSSPTRPRPTGCSLLALDPTARR